MRKRFLLLLLVLCLPVSSFAGWKLRVPKIKKGPKTPVTRAVSIPQVRGGGITNKTTQAATHTRTEGAISRGMQQGILRQMEVSTLNARIPARRSNPAFELGRKLREQREMGQIFVTTATAKGLKTKSFSDRIKVAKTQVAMFTEPAKRVWAEKEKIPEHQFYFEDLLAVFYFHSPLTAAQLRDIRTFYEKAISHPEIFTLDQAFADGLSGCLGISFVGDAYLAEKITSLAKAAPEGKRFLTDFVVVRSLLNLERYDLVQELMDFRQVQEGWFREGKLVSEGETACVYEEVKLYQQTQKDIPIIFHEQLPARNKFTFSEEEKGIAKLMEGRSWAMLFQGYELGGVILSENSAESLEYFLLYKHRVF